MSEYLAPKPSGPNLAVEEGATASWTLTADEEPAETDAAVLRLAQRDLTEPYLAPNLAVPPSAVRYVTAWTDDCEISAGDIQVVLDTQAAGLNGIEYLWQVDLIDESGGVKQRWRGTVLVMGSLP